MRYIAKPKPIPRVLFYNTPNTYAYSMIDTTLKKKVGEMRGCPTISEDFFISHLHIYPEYRRNGYGKKFLDFAKNMSQKMGFEGRMRLWATTISFDPFNPPHQFYRKYGFTADNKEMIRCIDKSIKKSEQLDYRSTPQLSMYYPDPNYKPKSKKINPIKRVINFMKNLRDFVDSF